MSATGRGAERKEDDRYYTRYPVALAICEKLRADGIFTGGETKLILEPSAGRGAFVSAAAETWPRTPLHWNDRTTALMLQEHRRRARRLSPVTSSRCEYLELEPDRMGRPDLIVGNPPYSGAEAHVLKSLELLADGGILAFLLRLNFLSGIERTGFLWKNYAPIIVYPLDKRPHFLDGYRIDKKGKRVKMGADSCEYGLFVWRKEAGSIGPVIRWLQWSQYLKRFENKVERIEKR